jgi:hypothetical protein
MSLAKNTRLYEKWSEEDGSVIADFLGRLPRNMEGRGTLALMATLRKTLPLEDGSLNEQELENNFKYSFMEALRDFPSGKEKEILLALGRIFLKDPKTTIDEALDSFESYIPYAQRVYQYFHKFYVLNDGYDSDIAERIEDLSENPDELRRLFRGLKDAESYDLVFNYRPALPLEITLKELAVFKANVEFFAKTFSIGLKGIELISPIFGFVADEIGRTEEQEKLFSLWDRYLYVYNLSKTGVQPLTIARNVKEKFGVWNTSSYHPTKLKQSVKKDLNQAEKMIQRAMTLSFPY